MNKLCSKCNIEKDTSLFGRASKNKDGLFAWCKECKKLYARTWSSQNRRSESKRAKLWYKKNKEKRSVSLALWQKNNKGVVNSITAKRRAKLLSATPKWLNDQHIELIKDFYKKSKEMSENTGIEHHVDHIVPLQGDNVSGLHVPWNLQIITKNANLVKGNSWKVILKLN